MKKNEAQGEWASSLALFSVIVAELVGYTAGGIGIGYLLYNRFGTPRWVMFITGLLGFTGAMFQLYRLSMRSINKK